MGGGSRHGAYGALLDVAQREHALLLGLDHVVELAHEVHEAHRLHRQAVHAVQLLPAVTARGRA